MFDNIMIDIIFWFFVYIFYRIWSTRPTQEEIEELKEKKKAEIRDYYLRKIEYESRDAYPDEFSHPNFDPLGRTVKERKEEANRIKNELMNKNE